MFKSRSEVHCSEATCLTMTMTMTMTKYFIQPLKYILYLIQLLMFLHIKIRYWVRRQNVKTKICRWHILPPYNDYI